MLSLRTQLRLANLIKNIAESEKKTEVVRQVLAEQKLFEPYTAFRRIDGLRNGQITALDLIQFFNDNNIIVTNREAHSLFKKLDNNRDGRVTYSDFAKFILPKEDSDLKTIVSMRQSYYIEPNEALPYEVEWSLARVLEQEIKNFRNNESQKEILTNSFDFNLLDAFRTIDDENIGFIDIQSLDQFLRICNQVLTEDELYAFFRIADHDEDGRVSYSEFIETVMPEDPTSKLQTRQRLNSAEKYSTPSKKLSDLQYQSYISSSQERSRIKNEYSPIKYQSPLKNSTLKKSAIYETPNRSKLSQSKLLNQSTYSNKSIKSPMKGNEEEHLVRAFKEQIQIDRDIEDIKKSLALKIDFNLLDSFKIFDKKGKGFISKIEFEIALNDVGIFPTRDELYLFFKRYDKDEDTYLKYSEFIKAMLPQSQEYASLMNNREPTYADVDEAFHLFSLDTQRIIKKLINNLFSAEIQAESLRQKLNRRPLFSIHDAFSALDLSDKGFATIEEFRDLLNEYGIFATTNDLVSLVKRYDKNADGKVSYNEFLNEMTPKSPQKY